MPMAAAAAAISLSERLDHVQAYCMSALLMWIGPIHKQCFCVARCPTWTVLTTNTAAHQGGSLECCMQLVLGVLSAFGLHGTYLLLLATASLQQQQQ